MGEVIVLGGTNPPPSAETIKRLSELLEEARSGHLIGIAFVALFADRYEVEAVGHAKAIPTYTRGALLELDERLRYWLA